MSLLYLPYNLIKSEMRLVDISLLDHRTKLLIKMKRKLLNICRKNCYIIFFLFYCFLVITVYIFAAKLFTILFQVRSLIETRYP